MYILTKPSPINNYLKRRLLRHLNLLDHNITSSTHQVRTIDISYDYHTIKDASPLTKTQIKVIITVVIIISFIMLIIAIFRFRNACRNQEPDNLQTEIIRNHAAQYSEPSSRRGSVGYYTRRYSRTTSIHLDDQLNNSLPAKRLSIPACDQSSKSTAAVVVSSSLLDRTVPTDVPHHHHVTSSCVTSNIPNQQISNTSTLSIQIKPVTSKLNSTISINHRHQLSIIIINYIKLSSPTLRKLCLPCITARNHSRQHSKKIKNPHQTNQRQFVTVLSNENNRVESLQRSEVAPRPYDTISTTPAVHSSDNSRRNNANHSFEQHQHFETSFQNEKLEEKYDKTSAEKKETKLSSTELVESLLIPQRSNEDDACDDQTPLLTSELTSTIKDSSNHTTTTATRKYSLNALLPLVRPSNSHPLCSSLTFTTAGGSDNGNGNGVDLKSQRRVSLSSALRRSSFAKQPHIFCSRVDSTITSSPPSLPLNSDNNSDRTKTQQQHIISNEPRPSSSSSSSGSYQKRFMQKIERFRFIDDSASSTTTITSPVESIERGNTRQTCTHLITSAIEQFDDFVRTKYHQNDDDDVTSLIDHLNSDILTNGSYSDLDILNNNNNNKISSNKTVSQLQTHKPVNNKSFQPVTTQQNQYRQSTPMNIPYSVTSLPLSIQRNHGDTNGHSRSMDFQSLSNKHNLIRPVTLNDITSSSSSTATLTSIRSSTSLEFDDNTKPSGVLVDDDFLPMSSPVDEHFWDVTIKNYYGLNNNECFPNVGSSPDVEIKRFDLEKLNTLSETSCDEDDDDDDNNDSPSSFNQPEIFSIHEYKIKQLQKPLVIFKNISGDGNSDKSSSNPSINSTEQFSIASNQTTTTTSLDQPNDELLLEKFSLPTQTSMSSDFLGDALSSSDQPSQIISEDDSHDSSATDASEGDESADNGEIDLVQEFELSQKEEEEEIKPIDTWTKNDPDVFIIPEDDVLSSLVSTPTIPNRPQPTSIMKIVTNKSIDNLDDQQQQQQQQQTPNSLKPKVRFNLDPQYEREREWNKVNKLLGNSVEWTDEFEV